MVHKPHPVNTKCLINTYSCAGAGHCKWLWGGFGLNKDGSVCESERVCIKCGCLNDGHDIDKIGLNEPVMILIKMVS